MGKAVGIPDIRGPGSFPDEQIVFCDSESDTSDDGEIIQDDMDDVEWWRYPYHKFMEEGGPLKTEISRGKYTNTYGPYKHDKIPRKNLLAVKETKIVMGRKNQRSPTKRQKPLEHKLLRESKFRSHTARHSMATCKHCQPFTISRAMEENFTFQYSFGQGDAEDIHVKMSIPTHKYYEEVSDMVDLITFGLQSQPKANMQKFLAAKDRLATWIFTPSHGDR